MFTGPLRLQMLDAARARRATHEVDRAPPGKRRNIEHIFPDVGKRKRFAVDRPIRGEHDSSLWNEYFA